MVMKRRRFKQTQSLQERLAKEIERLLEQAKVLSLGPGRSEIDRRITQNKAAIQLCEMLQSPVDANSKVGLQDGQVSGVLRRSGRAVRKPSGVRVLHGRTSD
jgi:hypothetical protein